MDEYPGPIGIIVGIIVAIVIWIYAMSEWSFLIGLMFGWIPALIGGFIAYFIWPLFALLVVIIIIGMISGW